MAPQDHPAMVEFPQRLVELCAAGWMFLHIRNGDGPLTELRGMRMWPSGYADALRLRYVTDAAAIRCDHAGGVLWERTGTLAAVADGLLALPAPGQPDAPQLVTSTLERLWTP